MLKKKSSGSGKKRKNPPSEERHRSSKRRSAESNVVDELADPELDRVGSDIEEGGLDLSVPFKPISAYVSDKKTMLEQCFGVLGEKKLRRMLPELFKDCTLEEIRKVCCEQLDPISERNIMQILSGEELTKDEDASQSAQQASENQKDNSVDSTECNEGLEKMDKPQQVITPLLMWLSPAHARRPSSSAAIPNGRNVKREITGITTKATFHNVLIHPSQVLSRSSRDRSPIRLTMYILD